ncbi:DUF4236 domain-containing protein [Brevundimonas sp.]|uniref:DUF4236 domain-containing protein n=1 Tax=Brevundimonas sp. TaxID=1871086 RepID=UPI002FCB6C28
MGFRFSRRIKLMPGVRLNLGLRGASLSAGPRGASVTIGKNGVYGNVGLPGSGLSYRTRLDTPAPRLPSQRSRTPPAQTVPTAPLVPAQFRYRFVDEHIEYLDEEGRPHDAGTVALIKSFYSDQLKPVLEERVTALNAALTDLAALHLMTPSPTSATPFPLTEAQPFDQPKPTRPSDPGQQDAFAAQLSAWQVARAAHDREFRRLLPDLEAIAQPILDRLSAMSWPRETNISLDLDEAGKTLLLAVDLPELEDMPATWYNLAIRELNIICKPLSASATVRLYADHVHSLIFRAAGEAFAAEGSIEEVRIGAYRQEVSNATGRIEDVWILAVNIRRDQWDQLDFGNLPAIDPKAALARFDLSRNMTAGGRFRPVPVSNTFHGMVGHD